MTVAVLSVVTTFTSAAVLSDQRTAGADAECAGVEHAFCKPTDNVCACAGAYKPDGGACVQKGLGDTCSADSDYSTGVTNLICSTGPPMTCVCRDGYTAIDNLCKKGLGNSCNAPENCTAVTGATCTASACACGGLYKLDPADNTKCRLKGLGDTCSANADCTNVTNSECSTGPTMMCVCSDDYTEINSLCKKGHGNTCSSGSSAVPNAGCAGAAGSEVCTCEANYKEENGQCSSANVLKTLLSAPVALLLSFLTIVVTRLH